jgi:heme/copper-type cytochrome/quinol oxidase subunit 2
LLLCWLPVLAGITLLAVAESSGWFCRVSSVLSVPESMGEESNTVYATLRLRTYECRVSYAGADGRLGTRDDLHVAGELYVPLDQDVTIHLTADDGPHRWCVPSLRRSIDVRKGQRLAVKIRASATGVFDMIVVDLSGCREDVTPARMIVDSPSDVQHWLNTKKQAQQAGQMPLLEVEP